jgi:hypothetical protein
MSIAVRRSAAKSLSDEGDALVMSSQVYAHASQRQSQSSDSGENLPEDWQLRFWL